MCLGHPLSLTSSFSYPLKTYKAMKSKVSGSPASLKLIARLFCAVFFSLLILMYSADWWGLNQKPNWPSDKLLMLRVAGSALLSFFACTLVFWVRGSSASTRLYFVGWFTVCMVLFLASWPGYFMSDSVSALKFSLEYPIELWLGFLKPFIFSSILQVFPHVSAITFIQLTIVAVVFAYATEVITFVTGSKKYALAFFALVAVNPSILFNMALLSRDTLFSVLVLWAAAFTVKLSHERAIELSTLLIVGFLSGLLVALRGDGWFVLLPFLISFAAITKKLKEPAVVSIVALSLIALFVWIFPKMLGYHGNDFYYKVANTINPVGYVLQSRFHTDSGNNKAGIEAVVNLDKLAAIQTPYEIPYWWNGGVADVDKANPEARNGYLGHVYGFLRENSGIFLAGRIETFLASTGFTGVGFKISDAYRVGWPVQWVRPESVNLDLSRGRPFPALTDIVQKYFTYSVTHDLSLRSGSALFWNFLPSLAISIAALLIPLSVPGLRLAAFIVLTRVPVVFLAAPASQFKYYLSVQMCGAFFLMLLIAGSKQRLHSAFNKIRKDHTKNADQRMLNVEC